MHLPMRAGHWRGTPSFGAAAHVGPERCAEIGHSHRLHARRGAVGKERVRAQLQRMEAPKQSEITSKLLVGWTLVPA